jgi:hypothetical protein
MKRWEIPRCSAHNGVSKSCWTNEIPAGFVEASLSIHGPRFTWLFPSIPVRSRTAACLNISRYFPSCAIRHASCEKHTFDTATAQNRLALAPRDLSRLTVRYIDHALELGVINEHHEGLQLLLFKLYFLSFFFYKTTTYCDIQSTLPSVRAWPAISTFGIWITIQFFIDVSRTGRPGFSSQQGKQISYPLHSV